MPKQCARCRVFRDAETSRRYRERHIDKHRAYNRAYYWRNRDRRLAYYREWAKLPVAVG